MAFWSKSFMQGHGGSCSVKQGLSMPSCESDTIKEDALPDTQAFTCARVRALCPRRKKRRESQATLRSCNGVFRSPSNRKDGMPEGPGMREANMPQPSMTPQDPWRGAAAMGGMPITNDESSQLERRQVGKVNIQKATSAGISRPRVG